MTAILSILGDFKLFTIPSAKVFLLLFIFILDPEVKRKEQRKSRSQKKKSQRYGRRKKLIRVLCREFQFN